MKKKYLIKEFIVMNKSDYEKFMSIGQFDYNTYIARMFNNFEVEVRGKILSNIDFNNLYTTNLC